MMKSRFTKEQIIAILAEQERGMATTEVCRKHGISEGPSTSGRRSSAACRCQMPRTSSHLRRRMRALTACWPMRCSTTSS